jgi:MerR family mercuric resistance operon transcriptional regulator
MSTTMEPMTVAGLATRVGVKPDTVRYYERIGLLPVPRRTAADHRRYDESAST